MPATVIWRSLMARATSIVDQLKGVIQNEDEKQGTNKKIDFMTKVPRLLMIKFNNRVPKYQLNLIINQEIGDHKILVNRKCQPDHSLS